MILTKTIELFGQNFRNIDFKDLNFEFNVYLGMIQFQHKFQNISNIFDSNIELKHF